MTPSGIFGREITKYTVIYGVCVQFWPTLKKLDTHLDRELPAVCVIEHPSFQRQRFVCQAAVPCSHEPASKHVRPNEKCAACSVA